MSIGKRLRDFFGDKQGAAIKRARTKILAHCEWDDVKDDIFPAKGTGAPVNAVVAAIIEAKHWKLLTPVVAEAGDWVGVIDLVYRSGEYGQPPAARAQELEDIYTALKAANPHGAKVAAAFVNAVEIWTCQHDYEAGYDWAKTKAEFVPVPALGLAALAEKPIEGNALAMKILSTVDDIKRAVEAVEWVDSGNAFDRDQSLQNLSDWRAKLEEKDKKPSPPKSPRPN